MFISLRKAAALQKEILATLPLVNTSVAVSIYSDSPGAEVEAAALQAVSAFEIRRNLMNALYEIRNETAKVNITSGISDLVTRKAFLEKEISFLAGLVSSDERPAERILRAKIERALNTDSTHYDFSDSLSFSVFPKETLESFRMTMQAFKKEKAAIQDQLLELNIKNSIKLSEDSVAVLSAQGLI